MRLRRYVIPAALFGALVVGFGWLPEPGSQRDPVVVSVTRVVDGDTFKVTGYGAKLETVRLIGVDTPETVKPGTPKQCYGQQASDYTKHELPRGAAVQLRFDKDAPERDHFGRVLAYAWLSAGNGPMLNLELVRKGYARAAYYKPHDDYKTLFKQAQTKAQADHRGRWGACPTSKP